MKERKLTWLEHLACRVMGNLKYNEDGAFYKCRRNDMILNLAWLLLGGRDPIDFACNLLVSSGGFDENEVKEDFENLR